MRRRDFVKMTLAGAAALRLSGCQTASAPEPPPAGTGSPLFQVTGIPANAFTSGSRHANKRAEVQAIGAIAVNQAVKALALAKGYLKENGYEVVFVPEFVDVEIEDKIRTAIKFVVELR